MKIEDCQVGMEVKPKRDWRNLGIYKKNKYKIKKIKGDGLINFGGDINLSCRFFEPVNKFEVGDEVIYDNAIKKYKVKIFGIAEKEDDYGQKYAISYKKGTTKFKNKVVREDRLSPLKKKDELTVGDKFKVKTAEGASKRINKVLGVFKDKYYNQTKYVAKRMNGNYEGFVDIYNSESIAEIIYD